MFHARRGGKGAAPLGQGRRVFAPFEGPIPDLVCQAMTMEDGIEYGDQVCVVYCRQGGLDSGKSRDVLPEMLGFLLDVELLITCIAPPIVGIKTTMFDNYPIRHF